ncbi:MAG: SpoIID/LytB domain-containing protein, partial [Agathobacter sp.]|nr:SpoIID/LytB domain-containing protein [Agathobacter sp.]
SMETYVKYVLPSEMQVNFGHEALKAQAVCARTYAYSQMKNQSYARYGANLDDSTAFQVYHNNGRYPETDAAVEETTGEVISCNGKLITCYYYSTSPGVTNDMSSWENTNPAYIDIQGEEQLNGLDLTKSDDFSAYMRDETESFDKSSPMYRWKAILNLSEIKETDYGKLESVKITERNDAGYVTGIDLVYEDETINLKNENAIRTILGKYLQETVLNNESVRTNFTMIPSACFEVVEQSGDKVVLRGGGFGHGIGMSQYGAKGMAEAGYRYKDIISYYYENVVVKPL